MTGLERKIIMDFVHDGMQTVAEYLELREFADAVYKIPEITPEIPVRDYGYIGKHEQNVSVYDAEFADLCGEKDSRRAKYMRNQKSRSKAKMQSLRYRNRSGIAEEKIPDNCHFRGHDSDRGYYRNWRAFCEMKSIPEWKAEDRERSLRKDWIGEQKDIDAEIYDAECLKKQIAEAKQEMNRVADSIEYRIKRFEEVVEKLRKLEDPTDWNSLWEYRNAVDTAYWYVFDY